MKWAGCVACMGDSYKIVVRKPDGKRPLVRPRHRWENMGKYIKVGCESVYWICVARGDCVQWALLQTQ